MWKSLHLKEFGRAMGLMKKRLWVFNFSCILTGVSSVSVGIINSLMYKNVVNGVVYGEQGLLHTALIMMILSIFLVCVVTPLTSYVSMYICHRTVADLRTNTFAHLLRLPKEYFTSQGSGEIFSRFTNDMNRIKGVYGGDLYYVLQVLMNGVLCLVTIFILEWRLSLVVVTLGVISNLINLKFAQSIGKISEKIQVMLSKTSQKFLDIIAGNRVIKLFNIYSIIVEKFVQENDQLTDAGMKLTRKEAKKDGVNFLLSGISYLGVLGVGAFMIGEKMIDPGTVVALFALRVGVEELFIGVGNSLANLQRSSAGVKRALELMDEAEETMRDDVFKVTAQKEKVPYAIALRDVEFSYDGQIPVLNGINMTFAKERVTALVGLSGVGKSTILKIILGIYAPQKGEVVLSGLSPEQICFETLRNQVAYVSQDAYLFDGTIAENIRYGNHYATWDEVVNAAKAANAHEFIMSMAEGYETRVGENSAKISGGQRQRIAIARALLKNAPILVLDEATSALDSESERLILDTFKTVMAGRTIIVVAHRLSTIQNADKIYVLDQGQVVAEGSHTDLLATSQLYAELHDLMLGE